MGDEVRRFLGAASRSEWWEGAGPWWRLSAPHGRALVRAARDGDGWAWAVQCPPGGPVIAGGRAPAEHEAMRRAERVLEEHRAPQEG